MSGTTGGNRYEYPNGVLRNKFGITDNGVLQQIEASFTFLRLGELANHPIAGQLDIDHLKAIHYFLFQDIYDWAGEIRQVDISKGNSPFAHFGYIESNARVQSAHGTGHGGHGRRKRHTEGHGNLFKIFRVFRVAR